MCSINSDNFSNIGRIFNFYLTSSSFDSGANFTSLNRSIDVNTCVDLIVDS